MQTSKFLLALGVLVMTSLSLQVQAGPDSPEQAKMRAALRRMMEQSAAPANAPTSAPQATTKTEVVPVTTPPPTAAATNQPAYESVPPPVDPTKAEREKEAMRRKLAESQAAPTTPAPVPTTPVAPAPVVATATPVAPPPVQTAYKPIEVPASSLPTSKQARLSDLLVRYKADTITALEYHTQRAAIIAEP
jgi:hypothetical protein